MSAQALPHPLLSSLLARPDHIALCCDGLALSARALAGRVARSASALRSLGVSAGQRVALRGPAGVDFVVALHAIGWLGACPLPLAHRAADAELLPLLEHADHRLGELPGGHPLPLPHDDDPVEPAPWALEREALLVATSGTTGQPRVIPLLARQIVFSAFASAIRLGHLPSDVWLDCLPLHHVGGLQILFRCALYGTTIELHERFDPALVSGSIDRGVALVSLVPQMLEKVLDARADRPFPPSLRAILLGGAAAPAPLVERCRRVGAPVALSWGMTEAASQVATASPGDLSGGLPPMPFVALSERDGALVIEGPQVAAWSLQTSDRGRLDERGRVHVAGRLDDVIISGGENIDPAEIEAALGQHPSVRECAVVGVDDARWGQRPVAYLAGAPVDDDELRSWCRSRLASFKVPDRFVWVAALPRNALGKIVRRALLGLQPGVAGLS